MKPSFRSNCPISTALDLVGDKWTLLIMRDMLFKNKRTFKDFLNAEEGIATNILTNRLSMLEEYGLITKSKFESNKKMNLYLPTTLGYDLIPTLVELALWTGKNKQQFNQDVSEETMDLVKGYIK